MKSKSLESPSPPLSAYNDAHTFIVRVWRENRDGQTDQDAWRGQISHVSSGRQRYFVEMKEIVRFVQEYTGIRIQIKIPWWQALINRIRSNER